MYIDIALYRPRRQRRRKSMCKIHERRWL